MGDVTAGARAPGVHGAPLRGVLPALARSPIDFLGGAWREHGDVVRLRLGSGPLGATGHLLVHPDHVLHVLVERQRDYELSTAYEVLRSVLGRGLLTSHAETWRTRRRLLQRAFAPARLERIAPLVALAAETGTERLLRAADGDQPIDLYAAMAGITYDAVGRSLFGVDVSASTPTVARALAGAQAFALASFYSPLGALLGERVSRLPTPAAGRYRADVRDLAAIADDVIERRRAAGGDGDDLLGLLIGAGPTDGGPYGRQALRDEALTFLLAGHETTASALTWTLALLSQHPSVRSDVHDELAAVLGGRSAQHADVERLPLLSAVVSEAMRLYPPAWMLERRASVDDVIGGFAVAAGSTVILSPYLTHRHPDFWPHAERFDPGRWLDGPPTRHRGAYLPFGAGPRQCIGGGFAVLEAKLVLATLLQRVDVDLSGAALRPVPKVTLTAGAGVAVTVRRRRGVTPLAA
jgi:cytochrome P450